MKGANIIETIRLETKQDITEIRAEWTYQKERLLRKLIRNKGTGRKKKNNTQNEQEDSYESAQ